ncbi:putative 1-phosphatidylinositol-3-phosphate 5-kinase FAB1D isoform X1 [Nicotiana tomentosiformis]|uniref:putative 1-phosphatidylinositol-3-phosphate 5-kinase FAB1D isoform X1 n=2 Tax=Nicotiana tomentosiformis TaxID=4098 RepID=UPI00051BE7DB|nr:putative 1-phosphatidylinositol-3-phosphate 5-kinase FAB1D isoform X1 [Nicotiana tomentosiformis]XP_009589131.1 putative 1-phosphatidylinositol-3-phosphate 5-kinase FAB1D isoform X1 [Nicotiana tomentosiformis]
MKKLENENSVQFDGGSSGGFSGDASSDGRVYIDECSTDSSQEECCSTMRTRRDAELMNGSCEETKSRKIEGDDDDESGIPSSYELDQFWEPPEPECCDDDMEGSVANYDDDECDNDLNWGKPTSLINLGEEGLWSYKFKEEKQKALEEVMNGKLKSLVNDLLKSFGVNSSACDNWVDIVTSLSWEAASFVKPDSAEGKAMDPNRYVKIKCIRTGSPSQSQFIRGLVFKKHAAHKHMPTKFEKARLLLIEGAVGLSSSELSSFHAMKEEKDNVVKSIIEILERYQPNVILVEETVSRDIQESILKKGWTLVFDMKKHRLERVAICTVSPTLSSEILSGHKLRQCDSFHFQRFVEEHDTSADGGKRPSKTLMFIEGCPTHLGCTILLMGANSDELKKIKCVVRLSVIMAYNLILETSFLLDQKAMFSTIPLSQEVNSIVTDETPSVSAEQEILSTVTEANSSCSIDVPISNGFHQEVSHNVEAQGNPLSFEPYDPVVLSSLSSLSASLNKVMGDKFPLFSTSGQSMPSCFSDNGANKDDQEQADIQAPYATEVVNQSDTDQKANSSDEEMASEKQQLQTPIMSQGESSVSGKEREDQGHWGNGVTSSADTDSILVLISSRNASRGTMCAHSHFSRIKFYQNFDIPLGKFLQHNLLSQKLPCTNCDGSPEDHIFYYAHYNKLLAIQVRSLPTDKGLPGESEGKIWMWSRCGRCKFQTGSSKSTKRVLVSTGSRGFSFGKFLELSFSNTSLFNRLSSGCGHSLHRDFLYFFGLGRMVAMFKYSTITTYSVSLPPEKLEFSSSVNGEFLKKELEDVYKKGTTMFLDVEKALKAIEPRFVGTVLNLQGSMRKFSEIEKMLKEERTQFEIDIQNAALDGNQDVVVFKLLTLNRIRLELLLESCVWDRRLHSLLSSDCTAADPKSVDQKVDTLPSINTINDWEQQEKGSVKGDSNGAKIYPERDDRALEDVADLKSKLVEGSCAENNNWTETTGGSCGDVLDADHHRKSNVESSAEANGLPIKEICVDTHDYRQDEPSTLSAFCDGAESTTAAKVNGSEVSLQDVTVNSDLSDHCLFGNESNLQLNLPSSIQLETDKRIIVDADAGGAHDFNHSQSRSLSSIFSNTENDEGWWTPFSEIWRQYLEDLQRGHLPKLGSITNHDVESTTYKLITHEGAKLHIPLGSDKFIVSDYEDEFSSIIACALALLKDLPIESEDLGGDGRKDRGTDAKAYESSQGVMRIFSVASPHLSSTGSLDLTRFHSSNISEETRTASLDGGLDLLNSSVSFTVHPEVSMGLGKLTGKYKYSVLCLYASQFRRLRDRWCTSEVDYIASLSRCRSWDAKGGKSKSLFAKTVDDRFIIKEIKRAEFDSFLKFATQYFEYMDQCHEKRNQTCLAKILGIYQVNVRPRGGKETRHDLMVMENLSFNRSTTRQYDLKGALHARFSSAGNGAGDVLLDQNFVNDMNVSPLYVGTRSKRDLQRAVWNDCTFLRSINVMDYSLLVGVDSQRCELVCGIIDYLRQYTWDKQLENWVKSSLVVPKNQLPTIVSPKEYYKRFRKFIDTHFLSVPDHWCSQKSSNPCKPYGTISGIASPQAESDGDSDQPKLTGEGEYEDANSTAQEKQNGFTT